MSQNKPQQNTKGKRQEQPPPIPPPAPPSTTRVAILWSWERGKTLVGYFLAALGFVTGYLSLVPRISVSDTPAFDITDPFGGPFIVSNDGPLGINRIDMSCYAIKVETADHRGKLEDVGAKNFIPTITGMEVGEKASLPCDFGLREMFHVEKTGPLDFADIVLIVKFRPDFVPWRITREFRYWGIPTPN